MKIVTLLNEKGGVGKTTLATHLAAGLAIRGKRVILVDADPQGHATIAFGLSKEPGFYDLIVRNAPFQKVLAPGGARALQCARRGQQYGRPAAGRTVKY